MPDVTPKTESGQRMHDEHHVNRYAAEPCYWLEAILAIEKEAASAAVAEAVLAVESMDIDQHGNLGKPDPRDRAVFARARHIAAKRVALIASERGT